MVTNIADPFVAGAVSGIEDMAEQHGYSVFLANSHADPQRELRVVRSFEQRRVDAIIVTSSPVGALYVPVMERLRISAPATKPRATFGHRRIAHIGDSLGHQSDGERLAGYRRALEEAAIVFDPVLATGGALFVICVYRRPNIAFRLGSNTIGVMATNIADPFVAGACRRRPKTVCGR